MLFSARINLYNEEPVSDRTSQHPLPGSVTSSTEAGRGQIKQSHLIGSLEVPEHYCKRRNSYCDQEEDEDKTDLEGNLPG